MVVSTSVRAMLAWPWTALVGVAVFCNHVSAAAQTILVNHVFDRICGNEPVPWLDRLRDLRRKALAQQETDEQTQQTAQTH